MLILGRKKGEEIIIEDGRIVITVLEVRGGKVRLGFKASEGISIHRSEVHEAIQLENKKAQWGGN